MPWRIEASTAVSEPVCRLPPPARRGVVPLARFAGAEAAGGFFYACGCYDPGVSANEWAAVLALAGIGAGAGIALMPRSRSGRLVLVVVMVVSWASAAVIVWRDRIAMNPLLYAVGGAVLAVGMAAAVWLFLRLPDRRLYGERQSKIPLALERTPPITHEATIPRTPVGEIYRDILAYSDPERARTIVAEAALERRKPNSPSSTGTSAAPHVVQSRIRAAPDQARQQLELLGEGAFAALLEMADLRPPQEQEDGLRRFVEAAGALVDKIEACKARSEMRQRDWQAIATLYDRANKTLSGVPLDKHGDYAEDLAKIGSMLKLREHPSQHPFTLRDLRDRLGRDQGR